jgi:hypothetical protein
MPEFFEAAKLLIFYHFTVNQGAVFYDCYHIGSLAVFPYLCIH